MAATDWIQALCAFATLLLAIITFWQGRKIKTLTDIVNSLEKQAGAAQELLGFEIKSRIYGVQPVFSPFRIKRVLPDCYYLEIKNRGQKARSIVLTGRQNVKSVNQVAPSIPTVIQDEVLKMKFFLTDKNEGFVIELSYEDGFGQGYKQDIVSTKSGYHVKFPEEISSEG